MAFGTSQKRVGTLNLQQGLVDITDPGYDNDSPAFCIKNLNVLKGKWVCVALTKKDGDIEHVSSAMIYHNEYKATVDTAEDSLWGEEIGLAPVDAGLMSFSANKPDFDDNAWQDLCAYMYNKDYAIYKEIFITSSYGDGFYPVYILRIFQGEIIAVKVDFM